MNVAYLPIITPTPADATTAASGGAQRSADIVALVAANDELVWHDDGTELRARIARRLLAGAR